MNTPIPSTDVTFRTPLNYEPIEGEVVAYKYANHVGLMVLDSARWFIAATHFDSDPSYIYANADVPDDTDFFYPDDEEKIWGYDYFVQNLISTQTISPEIGDPVLNYLDRSVDKFQRYYSRYTLLGILARMPFVLPNIQQYETLIWENGLKDIGVNYNRNKAELYCYFLSIVRIWIFTKGNEKKYNCLMKLLQDYWDQFSWMYGMALGRIVGSEDKNFSAQLNHLDSKKRSCFIHLYIPLIEPNIDRILKYNNVEKKDKLLQTIQKIKSTEELENQSPVLDELYQILFPNHFKRMMSANKPASSVAELKANYENIKKELELAQQRIKSIAANYEKQLNDMAITYKRLVPNAPDQDNSVSFKYIEEQLLLLDYRSAHDLSIQLNDLMTGYKGWPEFYTKLREKIRSMQPKHIVNIHEGATYNEIHDNINPTIQ